MDAEMREYEVFEVRRVVVRADSPATAVLVGALRLDGRPPKEGLNGSVIRVPRVIDLQVKEIR